jgi:hypothetical protein
MKYLCLVVLFLGLAGYSLGSQPSMSNLELELKHNYFPLINKLVTAFNHTGLEQYLQDVNGEVSVNVLGLAANMTALDTLFKPKQNGNTPLANQIMVHLKNSTILNSLVNALTSTGYSQYVLAGKNNVQTIDLVNLVQNPTAVQAVVKYYIQQGVIPTSGTITLSANKMTAQDAALNNLKNFPFLSQYQI